MDCRIDNSALRLAERRRRSISVPPVVATSRNRSCESLAPSMPVSQSGAEWDGAGGAAEQRCAGAQSAVRGERKGSRLDN